MWLTIAVGLAALIIGFAAGRWPRPLEISASDSPAREEGQVPKPDPGKDDHERSVDDWDSATERATLVASCADLADRLRDRQPALYTKLSRDLAAVGVAVQLADGEPFDAERHNAVGTEPTDDPASDLRVAATVRLGYLDHGLAVRTPEVFVYRCLAGFLHRA
jgi:hypothetical protein